METKDRTRVQQGTSGNAADMDEYVGREKGADGQVVSRRRALIAGLAAAPVILTLMNRSAWGSSCSDATVASFRQQGGLIESFQRHHPNAYLTNGGQLQCKQ